MPAPSMPVSLARLKVALVHDYLNQPGGAERVVEVFAEMFPGAPIYTSVYDPAAMPDTWKTLDVRTSFMQRISPRMKFARALVPLYPAAFELFDLSGYDLVLSSTTTFAKAVVTRPETCHICYCNNPTRFLWMYHDYLRHESLPIGVRNLLPFVAAPLRVWDFAAAQRPDYFVAGSHNAARRIAKYYRRDSDVVQPPIDASEFAISQEIGDFYLVVSRLQAYKRIDLAIDACNRLHLPLHIIGDGPDARRLRGIAGPTTHFFGRVADAVVREEFARCRALIFTGEEDFGLTPLEAQASGRPVIAFQRGGALETVKDGLTGVFFGEQTVDALASTLTSFDPASLDPALIRAHALQFDKPAFKQKLYQVISLRYAEHRQTLEASSVPG
jgi:glycosyltransferase involved in cell wall biosynthesis